MKDRTTRLLTYLKGLVDRPVVWGQSDCCSFVGAWVENELGVSLNRPSFASREEAHALMPGGMTPIWTDMAHRSGLYETRFLQPGDVAIIRMSFGEVGAIVSQHGLMAVRTDTGIKFMGVRDKAIVASWALPSEAGACAA